MSDPNHRIETPVGPPLAARLVSVAVAFLVAGCGSHRSDDSPAAPSPSHAPPRAAPTTPHPTIGAPPRGADAEAFTAAFVARARAQHPGVNVHATGPLTVAIREGGTDLALDNLAGECGGVATGCDAAFDRWIRVLFAEEAPRSAAIDRASVRAFLVPQGSLDTTHVVARPWVASLWEVMVLDAPDTITVMRDVDARQLGMDVPALASLAEANMRRAFAGTIAADSVAFSPQAPGVRVYHPTDSYGNSRLLLHDLWEPVAPTVRGELIAAAPARDIVVWAGTGDERDVLGVRFLAQQMFAHEPHPIAPLVLRFTPDSWVVYDANTEPIAPPARP